MRNVIDRRANDDANATARAAAPQRGADCASNNGEPQATQDAPTVRVTAGDGFWSFDPRLVEARLPARLAEARLPAAEGESIRRLHYGLSLREGFSRKLEHMSKGHEMKVFDWDEGEVLDVAEDEWDVEVDFEKDSLDGGNAARESRVSAVHVIDERVWWK